MPGTSPGTGCWFGWPRKTSSQRDVVVLLPRVCELLVAQHGERAAEAPAGVGRLDHIVDEAAAGGDERVGEFLPVFLRARLDRGGVGEVGAEDDFDRTLRPHPPHPGRG